MKKLLSIVAGVVLLTALAVAAQDLSVADLARQVRAERARKGPSRAPVFDNDNLPSSKGGPSGFSTLGPGAAAPAAAASGEEAEAGAATGEEKDEAYFRQKFADLRGKIAAAKKEADILQREFSLARQQNYSDPNQALKEQYSSNTAGGKELQDIQGKIDDKKSEIADLERQLSALEDELRAAGGDPGWAR